MKTTFIFHGGGGFNPQKNGQENALFYKEILKHAPENAKILLVPFAKDEDRIDLAIKKISTELNTHKWQEGITVAVATKDGLIQQIQNADVVYFHGGVSTTLLNTLKNYQNLTLAIEGKIIAGESAGMNVWSTYFYSPHANEVFEGLGVLPIKTIPHYIDEYKDKLKDVGPGLEEVLLPEHSFRVFYK